MKLRDNYGYPVTTFRNKPFINFIRYFLLTNLKQTFIRRDKKWTLTKTKKIEIN